MLGVMNLLQKLASSLVLQTNGRWKYLRIGHLFVGAYSATETLTIQTAVGSMYQTSGSQNITFPITLSATIYANVNVRTSQYSVLTVPYGKSATVCSYRVLSLLSRASASYTVEALVIGTI